MHDVLKPRYVDHAFEELSALLRPPDDPVDKPVFCRYFADPSMYYQRQPRHLPAVIRSEHSVAARWLADRPEGPADLRELVQSASGGRHREHRIPHCVRLGAIAAPIPWSGRSWILHAGGTMEPIPYTVIEVLGESAAHDLATWLARAVEERTISRDQLAAMNSRLEQLEHRFARELAGIRDDVSRLRDESVSFRRDMDARFEKMSAHFSGRLDSMSAQSEIRSDRVSAQFNERFDRLAAQFNQRFDSMSAQSEARFDAIGVQFNERFDAQSQQMDLRFERLEERMAAQTRWAVGMLGLMGTLVTLLLAIERLGIAVP